ncbi:MAG: M14 family zinc carboxypeptidase [Gammaproteobacteria bacterium]|nr:M14 family zinc carboxypeptidase [Gammaproteobacteria bacterium]
MVSPRLVALLGLALSTLTVSAVETVDEACRKISGKLASVGFDECALLDMTPSGYRSVDGFPMLIKEYPPLGRRAPQGRVLLVGGTHGDELSSISIVFKWMHTLERHHSGLFHWRINPLMNPDGALRPKHQRTNANGVDLNRNFATPESDYGAALDYWKVRTRQNKRRYPGPYPLSEPETYWLYQEIASFKPDVVIAVHAPYSLVDYDAPNRNNAPRRIGHLYKNLMGTYPGSLGNYAGTYLGVPVITLELPHSGIMPSSRQISALWTDLVRWLIRNINSAVMPVRATPTNLVPETPQSISRATPPGDLSLARN